MIPNPHHHPKVNLPFTFYCVGGGESKALLWYTNKKDAIWISNQLEGSWVDKVSFKNKTEALYALQGALTLLDPERIHSA